ncbi:ExbD/TolR family protein [Sphingobacterium pedocola]|uniref:Biopolymer transporter ExbD n=1 Tax=Sphingobacterium pedocola TaxID=2082722 RepID=A0ABR9T849_9SPHI|nr:biopolymer transporter ExbD [Sphingobacterium pedocola]MBE8721505.1 biopolymer transporter ExbD [Sphingobacterium pedocola]
MAELNQKSPPVTTKKHRVRRHTPKVDLTAMVDLAFLLITFFMLTTSLNKPNSLDVAMPDKNNEKPAEMDERRVISLLLAENEVTWYQGNLDQPLSKPQKIALDSPELRAMLLKLKRTIPQNSEGKDMIVLIKPNKDARTKDIIRTLDEMRITDTKRYMLSKISPQEDNLIVSLNLSKGI